MPQSPIDVAPPAVPGMEDAAYIAWLASRHRRDRSRWPRWWLWLGILGALLVHLLFLILVILAPVYLPDQPPPDRGEVLHVLLLPKAAPPAAGGSGGGALPRRAGPPREAHKTGHAPRRPIASFHPAAARHAVPRPQPRPALPAPRSHPHYAARAHRARAPLPAIEVRPPLATQAPRQSVQVSPPAVVIASPKWAPPRPPRAEGTQAMPPSAPNLPKLPTISLDASGVHATVQAPVQAVQIATVAGGTARPTSESAPAAWSSPPTSTPTTAVVEPAPVTLPPLSPATPAVDLPKIQPELANTAPAEIPQPPLPASPLSSVAETAPSTPELKPTPPAPEVSAPHIAVSAPSPARAPAATPPSAADDKIGDGSKVDQVSSGHLTMRTGRDDARGGHLGGPGSGAHLFNKDGSIDLPAASNGTGKSGGSDSAADGRDTSGLSGNADHRQSGSLGHYIERRVTDDENIMGRRSAHLGYTATRFDKDWTPLNESSIDTVARHTAEKIQTARQALLPSGVRLNCQGGVAAANPDLAKRSGLSLLSIGCREGKPASASRKDGDRRLDLAPSKSLAPPAPSVPPAPALPGNEFNNSAACATARVAGGPLPPGCPPLHKVYAPAPASSGSWAPPLGR